MIRNQSNYADLVLKKHFLLQLERTENIAGFAYLAELFIVKFFIL